MVTCLLGFVYGLPIAKVLQVTSPNFALVNLADAGLAAGLTLLTSLALLVSWLFYFDQEAVRRVGFVYSERLSEYPSSFPSAVPQKRASTEGAS